MYEDFLPMRLARLRTQKGVSARDMSLSLGQNENYINHIENGKTFPSMQAFFYICEYLDVAPKDFFDGDNENPALLSEVSALAKRLDSDTLQSVLEILRALSKQKS